jgi:hypothetical protein
MLEQQQEKQYYSRDILDSSSTTKVAGELSFLQHNVGRRQEVQQTLLWERRRGERRLLY